MSLPDQEFDSVAQSFAGKHGVDEKSMLGILVNWKPDQLTAFRKRTQGIFIEDERSFEKWDDSYMAYLENEFLRFRNAVVQWTMHPWERDARLARKALDEGPESYGLLIEVACTRKSEELLGARKAYQSLYGESMEEDVAARVKGSKRKLLVGLVSAYRYEGSRVVDSTKESEASMLHEAIKNSDKKKLIEDDETIRILTTRSKNHLNALKTFYKEKHGSNIDEDFKDKSLKDTINCLCAPSIYFSKVLDWALDAETEERAKEALTRVIVTRASVDMKDIEADYNNRYAVSLIQKIEKVALGNYKDFLITLAIRIGPAD